MKKASCILAALMLLASPAPASNPEITETEPGTGVYCGDPAATVVDTDGDGVGDTVYLYVGQDDSTSGYYRMPRYLCYSSTDMVNWKYEGSPMSANDFTGWGGTDESWAGQVIEYNGKFYYYMCKNASGISVGVADSPTGPFTALEGGPLVWRELTDGSVWQRTIDPTVWIENDENGVEHRYLGYGNGNIYLAELNEDMVSIKDLDGSGDLNKGDIKELIVEGWPNGIGFTEAPWIYRRPGDSRYYLFFASRWREELSYATADNIWGPYQYGGTVMAVGASSNTNHPAIIDFKGETYIIYHTGARERGSGYSRSVCIDRLHFDENGEVAQLEESSIGIDGTASVLTLGGQRLSQRHFDNSLADSAYPMGTDLVLGGSELYDTDSHWEIIPGLIEGENHVSLQSVNKMGYYITDYNGFVKLLHDGEGSESSKTKRTFIKHEIEEGTAYESLSSPGKYLNVNGYNEIVLSYEPAYFTVTELPKSSLSVSTDGASVIVKGQSRPGATLAVVLTGGDTAIAFAEADENGSFNCSFSPAPGTYTVNAAGLTAKITTGGAE